MSNTFTPLQRIVLDNYCEGEFKALDSMQQVYEAGDSLLTFVMLEAADFDEADGLDTALDAAMDELMQVRRALS